MKSFAQEFFNQSPLPACSGEILMEIENFLKNNQQKYNSAYRDNAADISEIVDLLQRQIEKQFHVNLFLTQTLSENFFENQDKDVLLNRHLRFLPPLPHMHNFYEIVCVLQGECINSICSQSQQLKAGDIVIIAPGTMHAISANSEDSLIVNILIRSSTFDSNFFYILRDQTVLSSFFKNSLYKTNASYLLFCADVKSEVFDIVTALYQEQISHKRYKNEVMNQLVGLFFSILLRNHEKDLFIPSLDAREEENNFIFVMKYMEANYQNINLHEMAQFFNYSERHMIRLLKVYTGCGFSENIKKIKLTHAAKLLATTNFSLREIASRVGYSNPSHLKQLFVIQYEMTPEEYRKIHRQKD